MQAIDQIAGELKAGFKRQVGDVVVSYDATGDTFTILDVDGFESGDMPRAEAAGHLTSVMPEGGRIAVLVDEALVATPDARASHLQFVREALRLSADCEVKLLLFSRG